MRQYSRAIHEVMVASGFTRDRSVGSALAFNGSLQAGGKAVRARVIFADGYLTRLPKLQLLDRRNQLPGVVAHIESDDYVCFAQEADLLLTPDKPKPTVAMLLQVMSRALDKINRLDLSDEIAREFPQHWLGKLDVCIDARLERSSPVHLFTLPGRNPPVLVLAQHADRLTRFGLSAQEAKVANRGGTASHVVVTGQTLTFRRPTLQPENAKELFDWMEGIEAGLSRRAIGALASQDRDNLLLFIQGANCTVGAKIILPPILRKTIQRPLFLRKLLETRAADMAIERLSGVAADEKRVFQRNMGDKPNLSGKQIALIGAGTIGGYLAKFLAQSGAGALGGRLVIFDEQALAIGNVGRHLLGMSAVGQWKATACRDFLRQMYPDNTIDGHNINVINALDTFLEYNILVDATGDMGLAGQLDGWRTELMRAKRKAPPIVHSWLVGNGVAAQALLVDDSGHACTRCLSTLDNLPRFRILRREHPASITPASCADGAYFAYGVGASAIAAGLATQMCLEWANVTPTPRFRTIRVDKEATFEVQDQNAQKLKGCPVCAD